MKRAKLADIEATLSAGGFVRFTWSACHAELIDAAGISSPIDGRTYSALVHSHPEYGQTSMGDTDAGTLIIEWRKLPADSREHQCVSANDCPLCGNP